MKMFQVKLPLLKPEEDTRMGRLLTGKKDP